MSNWFVFVDGEQTGPVTTKALFAYLCGRDPSRIYVWRDGFEDWKRASEVSELTTPPPAPLFAPKREVPLPADKQAEQRASPDYLHRAMQTQRDPDVSVSKNIIVRHWRGHLPLWVSYWVFGFLGNITLLMIIEVIRLVSHVDDNYNPVKLFTVVSSVWTSVVIFGIWQSVGVWRSAGAYAETRKRADRGAHWALLARLSVILGAISGISTFINQGVPQVYELSSMAFRNDPSIPNYSIRIMRDGTEAEIVGGFKFGLTDDFEKVINAARQVKVVHLDSIGGRLGEGQKMFELIRTRGLNTYVSSKCLSACTLAFAGGRERYINKRAILGFHQGSFPGLDEADSDIQKDVFRAAGFDSAFINRALSTPSHDMWRPPLDVLLASKVITSITDGTKFAYSGLGSDVSRQDIATKLAGVSPMFDAMRIRFPKEYDSIVQQFYDGIAKGWTEAETIASVRSKIIPFIRGLIPLADDDVLVEYSRIIVDQYAELGRKDPTNCYRYATGSDPATNLSSEFSEELRNRELALQDKIVRSAAKRAATDQSISEPIWNRVRNALKAKGVSEGDLQLMTSGNVDRAEHGRFCYVAIALFREIGRLPTQQAATLMRQTFDGK